MLICFDTTSSSVQRTGDSNLQRASPTDYLNKLPRVVGVKKKNTRWPNKFPLALIIFVGPTNIPTYFFLCPSPPSRSRNRPALPPTRFPPRRVALPSGGPPRWPPPSGRLSAPVLIAALCSGHRRDGLPLVRRAPSAQARARHPGATVSLVAAAYHAPKRGGQPWHACLTPPRQPCSTRASCRGASTATCPALPSALHLLR